MGVRAGSSTKKFGAGFVVSAVALALFIASCARDPASPTSDITTMTSVPDASAVTTTVASTMDTDIVYGPDPLNTLDVIHPDVGDTAPTVVVVHGGGWFSMDKRDVYELAQQFADRGFVVAIPNHRLVGTSGENAFPVPAKDIACATAWFQQHASDYGGDTSTMLIAGYSSGAHLAAMLAYDPTRDWLDDTCPVDDVELHFDGFLGISGPYDLRMHAPQPGVCTMLRTVIGEAGTNPTDCFEPPLPDISAANPVDQVTPDDPPAVLIAGGKDCMVSFPPDPDTGLCTASPESFAAALRDAGVPVTLIILPDAIHDVGFTRSEISEAIMDFVAAAIG